MHHGVIRMQSCLEALHCDDAVMHSDDTMLQSCLEAVEPSSESTCMVLLLAANTAMLLRLVPMVAVQAASQPGLMRAALCMAANMPGSTFTATVLSSPPHCGPLMVSTNAAASVCFICSSRCTPDFSISTVSCNVSGHTQLQLLLLEGQREDTEAVRSIMLACMQDKMACIGRCLGN